MKPLSGRLDPETGYAHVPCIIDCRPRARTAQRMADPLGPSIPPAVRGLAVIDTAATMSAVKRDVCLTLRLPHAGRTVIENVSPGYRTTGEAALLRAAEIQIGGGPRISLAIAETGSAVSHHRDVVALIGTDFLIRARLRFIYDARALTWELHQ